MINKVTEQRSEDLILASVLVSVVAMCSLIAGMRSKSGINSYNAITIGALDYKLLHYLGGGLIVLGAYATTVIASQISFFEIERGRQLASGSARFVFLSTWLTWGFTFLLILTFQRTTTTLLKIFLYLIFILMVFVNVFWSGGRSITLLLSLPCLLTLVRTDPRNKKPLLLITSLLFLVYVVIVTFIRMEGYDQARIDVTEMLDWQSGRLSMVAYAVDYVERSGFLNGESVFYAMGSLIASPLYLLGITIFDGSLFPVVSRIGYDLFGDLSLVYVVPGIVPELYMNFGMPAVIAGMYLVGVLVAVCERKVFCTTKVEVVFLSYYVGVVICLNLLNSSLLAFFNYVFLTGFPLWGYWGLKKLLNLKHRQGE